MENLCYSCAKGQLEMCPYFKEHFLETDERIVWCPEYEEDRMPENLSLFAEDGERDEET